MSKLIVNGGKSLKGEINIQGAKNSVLPLLAATYLCGNVCVLHNCPKLSDVDVSLEILECLGCKCVRENKTVTVFPTNYDRYTVPECLMREMRSSIVFMGAVAAKNGKAVMSLPGGCELGPRPIDIHIDALTRLGAVFENSEGKLVCEFPDGINGADIHLRFPSVGATENIMLASTLAKGVTVIHNAAKEPEISDLGCFLNKAGAKIKGMGTDTVIIEGVSKLNGAEHEIMPDRIVAATYMFAVAACSGKLLLRNANPEHLLPIIACLKDSGCNVSVSEGGIYISSRGKLKATESITTQPFPGFPTDAGPQFIAFSSTAVGTTVFVENIFDNRFRYIDELRRFGAKIKTVGRVAVVTGVNKLNNATATVHDLRGGAALLIAALNAEGNSVINKVCYIDRGYDSVENCFNILGADIKRV